MTMKKQDNVKEELLDNKKKGDNDNKKKENPKGAKKPNPFVKAYKAVVGWKWFWIVGNLSLAVIIVLALIFGTQALLDVGTKHGTSLSVPDFVGKTPQQAEAIAEKAGVRIDVVDSVFAKTGRGLVREQNPAPGAKVKDGRRIQLVVNAKGVQKVAVPNLVGYSARQAVAELNSRGLTMGRFIYVSDMATNNVLKQKYRGNDIEAGTVVEAEAAIDLVVGLNYSNSRTVIPNVHGKRSYEAARELNDYYLNVRSMTYDSDVKTYEDSLKAVVYKQAPAGNGQSVVMGTDVKLYLRLEKAEE